MPLHEIQKFKLLIHIEEIVKNCDCKLNDDIFKYFDPEKIKCSICQDTGTVAVEHRAYLLEMLPEWEK